MAQQTINIGAAANDGTGDTYRDAFDKVNDNFGETFPLAENALSKVSLAVQTVLGEVNYTGGLKVDGVLVKAPTKRVIVNVLGDFPAPVSSVITLADDTQYLIGNDVSLGLNELVMGDNCAVSGIESVVVTLTYTGTANMFTITNKRVRISNLTISCAAGRVINFADNTDTLFRMNDCSVSCATFGLFNSTGTNGSTTRFTNVSPSSISSGGCTILGDWNTWLWEVSSTVLTGGTFFNFGTATFDAIILDLILANLGAGTTLISGAAASANINTGGIAVVTRLLTSGAGTVLSTITVDDALWNFFHNDDIADTRPDGLLSMQNNATETVIVAASTDGSNAVLVAGTWVVERASQMTGTTAGRLTYDGGKDATLPLTASVSVEPASGTNINLSAYVAIGGVVVANSKRSSAASSGSPASITIPWQESFATAQFVEVFVENNDNTTNILVSSAISRAN